MREILFRGKRLDDGEWVEGYYVQQYGANRIYLTDDDDSGFEYILVALDTVGQYTGVTDKNGKKIFEGDIILKNTCDGKRAFQVALIPAMYSRGMDGYGGTHEDRHIEVIGNRVDNPELLKNRKTAKGADENEGLQGI